MAWYSFSITDKFYYVILKKIQNLIWECKEIVIVVTQQWSIFHSSWCKISPRYRRKIHTPFVPFKYAGQLQVLWESNEAPSNNKFAFYLIFKLQRKLTAFSNRISINLNSTFSICGSCHQDMAYFRCERWRRPPCVEGSCRYWKSNLKLVDLQVVLSSGAKNSSP